MNAETSLFKKIWRNSFYNKYEKGNLSSTNLYKSGNWDLLVCFCEMWILADTFYATAYFEPSQRSVIYLLAVNYFCKRNPSWTLSKKCPYSELFWSAFSSIPTEYGEMRSISRYRVSHRIQSKCGKMRTRITPNTDTFYAVRCLNWS